MQVQMRLAQIVTTILAFKLATALAQPELFHRCNLLLCRRKTRLLVCAVCQPRHAAVLLMADQSLMPLLMPSTNMVSWEQLHSLQP